MIFRKLSSANKEKKMNKEHALSCEIVAQRKINGGKFKIF